MLVKDSQPECADLLYSVDSSYVANDVWDRQLERE